MELLQALYDSEINFSIETFWDGGFDWKLGDGMNGYKAEGCARTMLRAAQDLGEAAIKHFPDSTFAKKAVRYGL